MSFGWIFATLFAVMLCWAMGILAVIGLQRLEHRRKRLGLSRFGALRELFSFHQSFGNPTERDRDWIAALDCEHQLAERHDNLQAYEELLLHPSTTGAVRRKAMLLWLRFHRRGELPRLLARLDREGQVKTMVELLSMVGRSCDSRLESMFLEYLNHDHLRLQRIAITTLRRIGTLDAVMPMLEYTKQRGSQSNLALENRNLAKEALATIQAREGGEAGSLSLAEPDALTGHLSLSDETGRLSLDP